MRPVVTAPYFTKGLDDVSVKPGGGLAKLECHVEGYPKPEILWQKSGRLVGKSRNIHMTRSGNRCILEISSIKDSDLGSYECIAVNIAGTAATKGTILQSGKITKSENADVLHLPQTNPVRSRSSDRNNRTSTAVWRSPSTCSKRVAAQDTAVSKATNNGPVCPNRSFRPVTVKKIDTDALIPSDKTSSKVFVDRVISKVKIPDIFTKSTSNERSPRIPRKKLNGTPTTANGTTHSSNIRNSPASKVSYAGQNKFEGHNSNKVDSIKPESKPTVKNDTPRHSKISNGSTIQVDNVDDYSSDVPEWRRSIHTKFLSYQNGPTVGPNAEKQQQSSFLKSSSNSVSPVSQREQHHSLSKNVTNDQRRDSDATRTTSEEVKRLDSLKSPSKPKHALNGFDSFTRGSSSCTAPQCDDDLSPKTITPVLTNFWPELSATKLLKSTANVQLTSGTQSPFTGYRSPRKAYEQHWKDEMIKAKIPEDNKKHDAEQKSKSFRKSGGDEVSVLPPPAGSVPTAFIATAFVPSCARQRNDCSVHDENVLIDDGRPGLEENYLHLSETINAANVKTAAHGKTGERSSWNVSESPATTKANNPDVQGSHAFSESKLLPMIPSIDSVQIPDILIDQIQKDDVEIGDYFVNSVRRKSSADISREDNVEKSKLPNFRHQSKDLDGFGSQLRDECDVGCGRVSSSVLENFQDASERAGTTEIEDESEMQNVPARINRGPQSVTVLRGESVTLAIHYSGRPKPSVLWMKGGTVLHDGGRHSILVGQDMSALSVRDVTADDSGKYVVCVDNASGGDSCFASVAVVGIPEPPGGEPTASEFTDHSLVLSWYGSMYDGGSVVTGYVLEMCSVPEMKWQKVAHSVNTSCEVQGLSCGQQYIFRVRAENRYGVSPPSRESQTICLDDYVDGEAFRDENVEVPRPPVTVESGSLFTERYELKEEVGKGRFGTVFRCVEKSSGRPRAAKMIRCIRGKDKVLQEIDIMNRLHHPKLLKLLAAFENGRNMVLVTEYISGGELFERVIAHDFVLTECDCVLFVRQICDAVAYMHTCSVLHLDLKPENILCKTKTSHQIKIIDFGLAKMFQPDDNLRVLFGTPEFVAPEVIGYEPVGPPSDMWSVGVICYVLLSGLSPFMGDTDTETFANITRAQFDFDEEAFSDISNEAKDFISRLLIKLPKRRMSAEECLKHPWLMRVSWMNDRGAPLSTEKLRKFIIRRKWQKSGTAIRALGRMVTLSKSSQSSSCETPPPVPGSPPVFRSRVARSETTDSGDSEVFRDSDSVDLSR